MTTNDCPYDSCHHIDTTRGDDFGGLGTSKEYREEDLAAELVCEYLRLLMDEMSSS